MSNATATRISIARGLAFAAVLMVATAGAADACTEQAVTRLGALGVAKTAISEVWIYRESTQEGGLQVYKAWASLKGCKGYAVIDMDTHCRPYQAYTTRECRIPGVANY